MGNKGNNYWLNRNDERLWLRLCRDDNRVRRKYVRLRIDWNDKRRPIG
jgi:hypothetical protein